MFNGLTFNISAIVASLTVMLVYNIHAYSIAIRSIFVLKDSDTLSSSDSSQKLKRQLARNWSASTLWMEKHLEKSDAASVTLAVQTFRNTIIVSTFMGLITFQSAINIIGTFLDATDVIEQACIIILFVLLFLGFLCFASVIRCASHLGFFTGVLSHYEHHKLQVSSESPNDTTTTLQ